MKVDKRTLNELLNICLFAEGLALIILGILALLSVTMRYDLRVLIYSLLSIGLGVIAIAIGGRWNERA